MEYKQTKTITCICDCNPTNDMKTFVSTFESKNEVGFIPTGVYVKQITYTSRTAEGTIEIKQDSGTIITYPAFHINTYGVTSNISNNKTMATFCNGTSTSPNIYFDIGKTLDTGFAFQINTYRTHKQRLEF